MVVLQLINSFSKAGAELVAANLLEAMPKDWTRILCSIVTIDNPNQTDIDFVESLNNKGIQTISLDKPVNKSALKAAGKLRRILKEKKVDVLHMHCESPETIGRIASIGLNIKRIRTIHNHNLWPWNPKMGKIVEALLSPIKTTSIGCSFGMDNAFDFLGVSKKDRIEIPNGIKPIKGLNKLNEKAFWINKLGLPENAKLITSIGRISYQKAHETLVESFKNHSKNNPNSHIIIAGSLDAEPEHSAMVKSLIEKYDLSDKVHLIGLISNVDSLMVASDLIVFPSRWEGLSLAILESLSSGTLTLATNIHPHPEIFKNDLKELLFEPEDSSALCNLLDKFINDSQKEKLVKQSVDLVDKNFTFQIMYNKYLEYYESKN